MAENEVKNIQVNGRTYSIADEKARKQIDEQNKNLRDYIIARNVFPNIPAISPRQSIQIAYDLINDIPEGYKFLHTGYPQIGNSFIKTIACMVRAEDNHSIFIQLFNEHETSATDSMSIVVPVMYIKDI